MTQIQIRLSEELKGLAIRKLGRGGVSIFLREKLEELVGEETTPVVEKVVKTESKKKAVKVWPGCAGPTAHECGLCTCGDK